MRLLRKYQAEGPGRNNRRVSLKAIAEMAGLHRNYVIDIRQGTRPVTEHYQAVLSPILRGIEEGRIIYKRTGKEKTYHYGWTNDRIEYRERPARPPPPQWRVIPETDYNSWATCRSCGSPHFSRFVADKPYYACNGCVSDADRIMLGKK